MIIAIDGPAGSGKSTIAHLVSARLGARDLDTGAMYRAVTYRALQDGLLTSSGIPDETARKKISEIAQREPIVFAYDGTSISSVSIGGIDVTAPIRTAAVDSAVSIVSAIPAVRVALTDQQRRLAADQTSVLEGRDIGTVVFPDAQLKIFLTARPEVRARRRALQNGETSATVVDEDEIRTLMEQRDARDRSRASAPLVAAEDAVVLDSSDLTIDEVVERIVSLAVERGIR